MLGSIPKSLTGLTALQNLVLSHNRLSGDLSGPLETAGFNSSIRSLDFSGTAV